MSNPIFVRSTTIYGLASKMLQWKSHQLETVLWQQLSVGNNNKWVKVTTPSYISESAKSLSWLSMNGMLQVDSCRKKSALKRARFWWQGSVLSWRLINKQLVSQTDFLLCLLLFFITQATYVNTMISMGRTEEECITKPI